MDMKKTKILLAMISTVLLSACGTKPIMPPLQYTKPIGFTVNKSACLNWEVGKQYSSEIPNYNSSGQDSAIGNLVLAAIDSNARARNPSHYQYTYGKAEQAIFMTSLKRVLEENRVFKHVKLTMDPRQVNAKDVWINIFFKRTRVADASRNFKVTLSVELIISANDKPTFKRTYLVESDVERSGHGFVDQQTDVSQELLDKVISGIREWNCKISKR